MNGPLRAAICGVATGGRTLTGLAALSLTAPAHGDDQPDATLRRTGTRVALSVLAVVEDVMDKLPRTPSRLRPPGLILRAVAGAGAGYIVAARTKPSRSTALALPTAAAEDDESAPLPVPDGETLALTTDSPAYTVACVAAAVASTLAGSWAGARWRGWAAPRVGGDPVAAGLEDAAVVGLAWLGAR